MAGLDDLTYELEALETNSRWARALEFGLNMSMIVLLVPFTLASVPNSASRFPSSPFEGVANLLVAMSPWLPIWFCAAVVVSFHVDLLVAKLLPRYKAVLEKLESDHPLAAAQAYGRIFAGEWWMGTHHVRNWLSRKAARHLSRHPHTLADLSTPHLQRLAGQWSIRIGAAMSEPDDQPLPALGLVCRELARRRVDKAEIVWKAPGPSRSTSTTVKLLETEGDPEELLAHASKAQMSDVMASYGFKVLLLVMMILFGVRQPAAGFALLGATVVFALVFGTVGRHASLGQAPGEHLFQVWRLRTETPERYLKRVAADDAKMPRGPGAMRGMREWVVKTLVLNPGLVEAMSDQQLARLRAHVRAAKPRRSLPAELLAKAKPLVGA